MDFETKLSLILEQQHDYTCILSTLSDTISNKLIKWGKDHIKDDVLYDSEADGGRELTPHITVLFGIHETNHKAIQKTLGKIEPFKIEFGKISKFDTNDKYDVIKVDIKGNDLFKLNKSLQSKFECTLSHNEYKPHATIAYVAKGSCDDLLGDDHFSGLEYTIDTLTISSPTEKEHLIDL